MTQNFNWRRLLFFSSGRNIVAAPATHFLNSGLIEMEGYAFVTIASRLLFLSTNNQLGFWKDCVSDLDRILVAGKKKSNKKGDQGKKKVDTNFFWNCLSRKNLLQLNVERWLHLGWWDLVVWNENLLAILDNSRQIFQTSLDKFWTIWTSLYQFRQF